MDWPYTGGGEERDGGPIWPTGQERLSMVGIQLSCPYSSNKKEKDSDRQHHQYRILLVFLIPQTGNMPVIFPCKWKSPTPPLPPLWIWMLKHLVVARSSQKGHNMAS